MSRRTYVATIVALFVVAVSLTAFSDPSHDAGAGPPVAVAVEPPGPSAAAPDVQAAADVASSAAAATGDRGALATVPAEPTWPGGASDLVTAFRSGDWRLVAAFALIALMIGLRRVRDHVPWFKGDRGGAIMVMVLSLAGAFSTSLATGAPVDLKMALSAAAIAWTAVGGYTWLKKLVWPADADNVKMIEALEK